MFERSKGTGSHTAERGSPERVEEHGPVERGHGVPLATARHERERSEFGGFSWGSAFFGWLVALGLAALLTAIASAAGAAIGITELSGSEAEANAETIGIAGGAILLAILAVSYYAGGYVAGRMSRFDGARQGFGVWALGLLVTIALAVLAAVAGSEYNVLERFDLPRIPVDEGDLTTGGIIALAAILVGTLIAALAGGKAGERFHRRVDRVGHDVDRERHEAVRERQSADRYGTDRPVRSDN